MSEKATVHIGVEDEAAGLDRFAETWERLERGEQVEPEVHVKFADFETLLRVLTARRLELLRALHACGAMSVRALSKHLDRDYKNVHTDVAELEAAGLIQRTEEGLIAAPWESIESSYSLVA